MEKTTLVVIGLAILLIAGVVLVSADFEKQEKTKNTKVEYSQEQVCGPQTCNGQCGGTCGIPSCGCGK